MKAMMSEKEYQHFIMDYLEKNNGYVVRDSKYYDMYHATDTELLFKFLWSTQPDEMTMLSKIYKDDLEETILGVLSTEFAKTKGSLLAVLKNGIYKDNVRLRFMYTKPATDYNNDLVDKYNKNIFSVMEEVNASDKERVDLVIFLNGLAIMSFELKCNTAGQSYHDAIEQYRLDRNPKTRLFLFKSGCLVNFAMDLEEVHMTTKLNRKSTWFLPFNKGNGEGVFAGSGNPYVDGKYSVSYMWEDILTKDSILELISKFMFVEYKEKINDKTGKKTVKENVIFPRFHQRDVVHKLLEDVKENGTLKNYLIQHSAGSGKTNSIAWLAHRLTSLHDSNNKVIFDNIIIVTDRIVVDRQLQDAVRGMEHASGLIKVMDDKCSSADLADALKSNTKIIATTIQKFPYIVDEVKSLARKRFAVIIDEAHSSTSGKDMAAVTKTLGSDDTIEDFISDDIRKHGKQKNVSMFAFTATPKPTTLQLFGSTNIKGQKEAFHIYSMKQAIEEGFILDVLQNYITYKTYYKINKEIEDDPKYETVKAKRKIARFAELHHTNITQRIEVIIEHFRNNVMHELGGTAKAMVVTGSREEAVKYRLELENYINKRGYTDIHALIAFTGKLNVDDVEYSEAGMNGFSPDKLTNEFNKDEYRVLLVANKYQTGFDQPKLSAMYIMKKLRGVNAVQTLSRLNRICPPYDKKTFILDFVNDYDDMVEAFSKYYTVTILSNSVTPESLYELEVQIDGYNVLDEDDIDKANTIMYMDKVTSKEKTRLTNLLQRTRKVLSKYNIEQQLEFVSVVRKFVKYYEFVIQATCFEDIALHKKYNFLTALLKYLDIKNPGIGFNLDGKIEALGFVQKMTGEHKGNELVSKPLTRVPSADRFGLTEDKEEKLSEIIAEINSRYSKKFDNDVAIKSVLQIKDVLEKSPSLEVAAKNNTESDFRLAYDKAIDDALSECILQNRDFFTLLLEKEKEKQKLLGIFANEIYNSLRLAHS